MGRGREAMGSRKQGPSELRRRGCVPCNSGMSVSQGHKVSLTRMLIGTKGLFVQVSRLVLGTGVLEIKVDCMQLS